MKTKLFISLMALQSIVNAQSFTILPNNVNSNALNSTANKVGINVNEPNAELQINRAGNVNSEIQFTNGATGTNVNNGLWFGIDNSGKAILNNKKVNSEFLININQAGSIGNGLYRFEEGFSTNRSVVSNTGVYLRDTSSVFDENVSYYMESSSYLNTVGLKLRTQGYISDTEFSIQKYPYNSTVQKVGFNMAGNTVFENKDAYNSGSFVFIEKDIKSVNSNAETRITPNSVSIGIANTANVSHSLEVNGTAKIGTTGNKITAITNYDRVTTFSNLPSGATQTVLFNLTNIIKARNTVIVSPNVALPLGLSIASAMVSSDDWIEVRFTNTSTSTISLPMTSFNFTVFTF